MAPVVPWMTRTDRYILDLLDEAGIAIPPMAIWLNLRDIYGDDAPSRRHVARRLGGPLTEHGLIDQPFEEESRGYYRITDLGERYLHDSEAEPEDFTAE